MTRVRHHRPSSAADAFNCPNCGVYAQQHRWPARIDYTPRTNLVDGDPPGTIITGWAFTLCEHCGETTVWYRDRMIYPDAEGGPPPNPDLPEDIRRDYLEAQSIVGRSPRGAAALLRLCIQKLCEHLGEKGKNINDDIASLVTKGLPLTVQQALDAVRVIGNEALHPGQMDLRDDRPIAETLFQLVNFVAQKMISEPKQVQAVYDGLPQAARDKIAKRDQPRSVK